MPRGTETKVSNFGTERVALAGVGALSSRDVWLLPLLLGA